jgi:antitoxin FitA
MVQTDCEKLESTHHRGGVRRARRVRSWCAHSLSLNRPAFEFLAASASDIARTPPGCIAGMGAASYKHLDMCKTCKYHFCMSKMIQLRNVPDALHRTLKVRAAMAGMSLSDYLLAEIKEIEQRPTLAELQERLHQRKPVAVQLDTARLVREEREAR